jgi:hypothetical protein
LSNAVSLESPLKICTKSIVTVSAEIIAGVIDTDRT